MSRTHKSFYLQRVPVLLRPLLKQSLAVVSVIPLLSLTLMAQVVITPVNAQEADARPNILLIMADDMGYTDIGSFGGEIRTPNIDALALTGLRLTNYHVASSCAPTRTMLMSGTYPQVGGISEGRRGSYLADNVVALPQLMKDAGYHTYMTGKWHLGSGEGRHPGAHGFESSFALTAGGAAEHFKFGRNLESERYTENGTFVDFPDGAYSTDVYTNKMIAFLESNEGDGVPFFAWYTPTAPHWPIQVPDDYLHRYDGAYDTGYDDLLRNRVERAEEMGVLPPGFSLENYPRTGQDWESMSEDERRIEARKMEIYAAMVENFDFHVGRLIGYLRASGQFENTIIIFSSDNGADASVREVGDEIDNSLENLGRASSYFSIGAWGDVHSAPFRWQKGTQAEGGIRAPAFIHHASLKNKGGIDNRFLSVLDLMPTFLELAGSEHPKTEYEGRTILPARGTSFVDLLNDDKTTLVHQVDGNPAWYSSALYRQEWKLVRTRRGTDNNEWMLFNVRDDPSETRNLAGQHPELLAEMIDEWTQIGEEAGARTRQPAGQRGDEGMGIRE